MKLIVTASIEKNELKTLEKTFSLDVIKIAAKKSFLGLGKEIKSSLKIPGSKLRKIPLTSTGGAGRALFLLQIDNKSAILVMVRLKNDKLIGTNISLKNPKFKKVLDKNLALIMKDIENDDYEEFEL